MTPYAYFYLFVLTVAVVAPLTLWATDRLAAAWHRAQARVDADIAYLDALDEQADATDAATFDTVERWRREQRVNEIAAEVRAAFEETLANRPHLAAIRARQEAAGFDADAVDWTRGAGS